MEELSPSTSWMKKVVLVILGLVVVLGVVFTVFASQQPVEECETEEVTPADIDAESSPF